VLTHRERVMACLKEDASLDHPPAALWRHFPVDDQQPGSLAAATLDFQRHYEFDLVKVTPASSFSIKDWGAVDAWEGHTEGTRRYTRRVIQSPGDWNKLPVLDPRTSRHLSDQIACLKMIRASLGSETPLLQTVFSPLAQAKNLAGGDVLVSHLRLYPGSVLKGLETIAKTTRAFIESARDIGIDGIFYAIQHAQAGILSMEEYKAFGLTFDLDVSKSMSGLWCNMLHLHGLHIYFDSVLSSFAPAGMFSIINWHDRETPPSLKEAQEKYDFTVCGGINQNSLVYKDNISIKEEALDAIAQTTGRGFIMGTGCVVPIIAPHGNIQTVVDAVKESIPEKKKRD
jgi:uroporphyrinogen decarboxylase